MVAGRDEIALLALADHLLDAVDVGADDRCPESHRLHHDAGERLFVARAHELIGRDEEVEDLTGLGYERDVRQR